MLKELGEPGVCGVLIAMPCFVTCWGSSANENAVLLLKINQDGDGGPGIQVGDS
jgi:hypothetical protein